MQQWQLLNYGYVCIVVHLLNFESLKCFITHLVANVNQSPKHLGATDSTAQQWIKSQDISIPDIPKANTSDTHKHASNKNDSYKNNIDNIRYLFHDFIINHIGINIFRILKNLMGANPMLQTSSVRMFTFLIEKHWLASWVL